MSRRKAFYVFLINGLTVKYSALFAFTNKENYPQDKDKRGQDKTRNIEEKHWFSVRCEGLF